MPVGVLHAIGLAAVLAAAPPGRSELVSGGAWRLSDIHWQTAAPNGTKFALLEGRRDVQGDAFTYAFFIPAGVWDSPHWHSKTARVFVAQGSFGIGYGDKLDVEQARLFEPGSYVLVPGDAHHFDGAPVDTIIIGVASGVWSTTYIDGSKPASAGTPSEK